METKKRPFASSPILYMIRCRHCDLDVMLPFSTPEKRLEWKDAHSKDNKTHTYFAEFLVDARNGRTVLNHTLKLDYDE